MIDSFCKNGTYDKVEEEKISNKYPDETEFLISLENMLKLNVSYNNYNDEYDIIFQNLKNLRHRLYRVAVIRVLKFQGKEFIRQEVVSKDYNVLLGLIK